MTNGVKVIVMARDGNVWEGEGDSCSMENKVGPFDVLGEHAQMVAPIFGKITVRRDNKIIWEHTLAESGLCKVKGNQVTVWVGI